MQKEWFCISDINELRRIKELIKEGKARFENRKYDVEGMGVMSYDQVILHFFEMNLDEAWNICLSLRMHQRIPDYEPYYKVDGRAMVFKRMVNNTGAYIKLKIEHSSEREEVVCISFHPDW